MDITGKIVKVMPEQSGEGRKGTWRVQDYVIEFNLNTRYPRKMVFSVRNEKIDEFKIQEGQMVTVDFDLDAHDWQGRWFNNVTAWRVVSANAE